jgi:hypothetical protein
MKKLITVLVLAFTASFASAQNQGTPYMFTGKLISTPTNVISCGTLSVSYAYEFEITMFSNETYTQQNIAIVVDCPDILGTSFFKIGATYKMELFTSGSASVVNQTLLDTYNLSQFYTSGDIKRIQ